MDPIQRSISVARRRFFIQTAIDSVGGLLLTGLIVVGVIVSIERLLALPMPPAVYPAVGALVLIAALVRASLKLPSRNATAALIDQRLGLKDRLATALYAANLQHDEFSQHVVRDAQDAASHAKVQAGFPIRLGRAWGWIPPVAGVVALLAVLMPTMDLAGFEQARRRAAVEQAQAAADKEEIAKVIQAVNQVKVETGSRTGDDPLDAMRELAQLTERDLRSPQARRDAAARLSEVQEKLAHAQKKKEEEFKPVQNAMSQLDPKVSGPADAFADALRRGDFQAAQKALDELAKSVDQLSDAEKQALQQQLQNMAQQLQQLAQQAQQQQQQAQQQMQQLGQQAGLTQQQLQQFQNGQMSQQQLQQAIQQQLQQQGMSQQQAQQMARQMQQAQQQSQGTQQSNQLCNSMGSSMSQMAQSMQQGQGQQGQQFQAASQGAQQQMSQMAQMQRQMQQYQQAQQQMQQSMQQMASGSGQQQQGQGQGACSACNGTGKNSQGGQCSACNGSGQGQGQGQGQGGQQMASAGGGRGGSRAGTADGGNPLGAHSQITGHTTHAEVEAHEGQGKVIASWLEYGEMAKGEPIVEFDRAITQAKQSAEQAVTEDRVPRRYHESIKEYFNQLPQTPEQVTESKGPRAPR